MIVRKSATATFAVLTLAATVVFLASGCDEKPKSGSLDWSLSQGKAKEFSVYLFKDHKVELSVKSEKNSDVDLWVFDGKKKIEVDESVDSDCFIQFEPTRSDNYKVVVVNRTHTQGSFVNRNGPNSGTLSFKQSEQ